MEKNQLFFYPMDSIAKIYNCNETGEVGFFILNDYGYEQNIKYIREFINFLRKNKVVFDHEGEEELGK